MQGRVACDVFFFSSMSKAAVFNLDTGFEGSLFHFVCKLRDCINLTVNLKTKKPRRKIFPVISATYIFPAKLDIMVV